VSPVLACHRSECGDIADLFTFWRHFVTACHRSAVSPLPPVTSPDLLPAPAERDQATRYTVLLCLPPTALFEVKSALQNLRHGDFATPIDELADDVFPWVADVAVSLMLLRLGQRHSVGDPPAFATSEAGNGLGPELVAIGAELGNIDLSDFNR